MADSSRSGRLPVDDIRTGRSATTGVTVNAQLTRGPHADVKPSPCPSYRICPGDRLEVGVVQPDGGHALVVGKLDAVPKVAGGCAMRTVVCDAQSAALPAK